MPPIFVNILYEAGIPERRGAAFLPARARTAGEAMVTHPKTRFIAFTGSKEAGLRIAEQAAKTQPGQIWIKRTVLEMGGKDAIIVDEEADIDAAVEGVAQAAFGYQGQKCSACSRAIVVGKNLRQVSGEACGAREEDQSGPAEDPGKLHGPGDQQVGDEIDSGLHRGGQKRRTLGGGRKRAPGDGYFIEPTVIADVDPKARIFQEEIFGPVLAVIKAKNFDDALEIANDTEFGLTGAVYSKEPAKRSTRGRGIPRRQSVPEPQMHRRDGGRASLRRIQYVRNGFQVRRPGLSAAVPAGENRCGKGWRE